MEEAIEDFNTLRQGEVIIAMLSVLGFLSFERQYICISCGGDEFFSCFFEFIVLHTYLFFMSSRLGMYGFGK